ncbi:hypothetical protein OG241_06145 [Streptomyces sp. NBC_01390]|uniref:hypothetical protein n=1 Tax=Streptomyces sp. NBC_01390 TaxID=2903850 RepID=UPI003249CF2A
MTAQSAYRRPVYGVPRHVAESHLPLAELLDAADHAFGHLLPERIPERAAS